MERETCGHDTFLLPFTWRYGSQEMRRLWSEGQKRRLWRRIWVALAEADREAGLVSEAELDTLTLAHVDEWNRQVEEAGIGNPVVSPILLPDYTRKVR